MKRIILLLLLGYATCGIAQKYNPLLPPNTYRNPDNPNYWKNKMPHPGYWQQDVHYRIKATIDEKTDIITATEKLTYWNNSPDTLHFVFFHLYQNAFQPGSYYDELHKVNKRKTIYGKYEQQKKGTEILQLKVDGKEVKTELDNTVLKVYLPQPLLPGENIDFDIDFKTYFDTGNIRRRMKVYTSWGYKHYNGVHWYPRISVYDRKFGWTTDQHLGKEFYGDFGTFDVELTFASNFIVEATGFLLNRDEVLPKELRQKLDIKNFADKPWNSPPSEIIPYDSLKRKTWKFHAENVHDFAFTADPTYRIGEAEWDGIKCYALVQEPHAAKWQNAAEYTAKIIQIFSEDFGRYTYHKMIVADARDGMEYPMLTLDGGWDPDYRGLFVHEIGHNWFFGQVGNNETYRAALDEGFTQFLTAWGLQKLEGDTIPLTPYKSKYKQQFKKPYLNRVHNVYYGYLIDAIKEEDMPLNTRSDDFNNALGHGGGYRHVYYKTATMLYNLQYVLGDALFQKAMKHYFAQWKIAHPYFEDFRNSVIRYTHVDLNWFFDQWLETTKRIDYSVKSIKKLKEKDSYQITFERKGSMEMPLDFTVSTYEGKVYNYHIPNNWFVKKTSATVLPRWIGWGKLNKTYKANIHVPGGIKTVVIDTTKRLADVNYLNNYNYIPVSYQFDSRIYNRPDLYNYEIFARPEAWYNGLDGLKAGIHLNGNYMRYKHIFTLSLWMNSGLLKQDFTTGYDQFNYRFTYKNHTEKILKRSDIFLEAKLLDGLSGYKAGFEVKTRSKKTNFFTYYKLMYRKDNIDLQYLIYPNEWLQDKINSTINLGLTHQYTYIKGKGIINILLKSSSLESDFSYAYLSLEAINTSTIKEKFKFRTRLYTQYGTGNNWAPESQLYLAGANPEEMMENKFVRSKGWFPAAWASGFGNNTANFQYGGGLNLRGYNNYLVVEEVSQGDLRTIYKGTSGIAVNGELEFNKLIKFNPRFLRNTFKITTYMFGDAGWINVNTISEPLKLSNLRADAGLGATFTINKWGPLEMVKPLTLRFDVPIFLNRIPAVQNEYTAFRWLFSISRAF